MKEFTIKTIFWIIVILCLTTIILSVLISDNNTNRLRICAENGKTYITFSEAKFSGSYCGDILELKALINNMKEGLK